MSRDLTDADLAEIRLVAKTIAEAVVPELVKVAAAASGSQVHMAGELLVAEPAPQRDYRKELWSTVFASEFVGQNIDWAAGRADDALATFDKRFPNAAPR